MSNRAPVFVREATGLVREISWFSVFVYGMTVMGFQFTFYYIASLAPLVGGNIGFGFLVMGLTMLSVILVYHAFTVIMPRSGGDYVFVGRNLHPLIGFVGNLSYGVTLLLYAAINGVTIETTGLSQTFAYFGALYNNPALSSLASTVSTPLSIAILGLVWIIAGALVVLGPVRLYLKVQNLMFVIVLIGALAMIVALVSMSQPSFISSFNGFASQYMGKSGDYYQSVIKSAAADGWMPPETSSLYGGLLFYPIVAVGGFYGIYGAQISGEIRNPKKSYLLGSLLGAGVYLGLTGITLLLLYNAMGFNFLSAIDYLLYNNPSQIPLPALPYANLLISVAANPVFGVVIFLAGIIQLFMFICSAYLFMSRGLFAYSFDRLISDWFTKVSDRTHGPLNSIIASTIITVILFVVVNIPASATYVYLFSSVATWWQAIFPGFFVGLVALVVCVRRPQLYKALPIKGWKLAGLGLSTMFFTLLQTYLLLTNSVYGANTPIGIELVAGAVVVFIVIYLYAWLRRGPSLRLAFKEIPPE